MRKNIVNGEKAVTLDQVLQADSCRPWSGSGFRSHAFQTTGSFDPSSWGHLVSSIRPVTFHHDLSVASSFFRELKGILTGLIYEKVNNEVLETQKRGKKGIW